MSVSPEKPIVVVSGVVIARNDTYLLVQEKKPRVHGKWNLPAGRVEFGEPPELAAVREAKEECGFDVQIKEHLLTLRLPAEAIESPDKYGGAALHAYSAVIIGGTLQFPKDEILDARWFSYEEVKAMQAKNEVRVPEYAVAAIEKARAS